MRDAILYALPPAPAEGDAVTHWWHVSAGEIVASGEDGEWLGRPGGLGREVPKLIAVAPSSAVRLVSSKAPASAATPRQAAAIARRAALETSIAEPEAMHAVSRSLDGGNEEVLTALVENGAMQAWLDWSQASGADPDHVVPAAALFQWDEQWSEAAIGQDRMVGRRGLVLPAEPDLLDAVVGDAEVRELDEADGHRAIISAAAAVPLDLRTGRFGRSRRLRIDRARIRELVLLACLVPLLTLLWSIASILQLNQSTGRIDSETLGVAEAALGRPVTLESAEAELRQRAAGNASGVMTPLSALYRRLEGAQGVGATEIGYRPDGTLLTTLAAASVDPINQLLVELQRDGYRITAVPRQAPDGRAAVDVTVRTSA